MATTPNERTCRHCGLVSRPQQAERILTHGRYVEAMPAYLINAAHERDCTATARDSRAGLVAAASKQGRPSFVVSHPVGHGFRVIEQTKDSGGAEIRAREALDAAQRAGAERETRRKVQKSEKAT